MKFYAWSIFTRLFVAFSAFLFFIVSAGLFGAEGRGIISYGTSVFAFIGLALSFNLGRTFLAETLKNEKMKRELLSDFIFLNIFSFFLVVIIALIFWNFDTTASKILSPKIFYSFLCISLFYIWHVNSNAMFSAFQSTHVQEKIIFLTRLSLCIFLFISYLINLNQLEDYVLCYSGILFLGAAVEIYYLAKTYCTETSFPKLRTLVPMLKKSFWPHLDYLAFNLFPVVLILISAKYIETEQIGRVNFALQFVSVIFIFSTVATNRISSYVSVKGFGMKTVEIKKIFIGTGMLSVLGAISLYIFLKLLVSSGRFVEFNDSPKLFLITALAVPGYIFYHFLVPLWLEMKVIKHSALANLCAFLMTIFVLILNSNVLDERFVVFNYSLFYLLVFIFQAMLFLFFGYPTLLRNKSKP